MRIDIRHDGATCASDGQREWGSIGAEPNQLNMTETRSPRRLKRKRGKGQVEQ